MRFFRCGFFFVLLAGFIVPLSAAPSIEAARMRSGAVGGIQVREFSRDVVVRGSIFELRAERLLLRPGGSWHASGGVLVYLAGMRIAARDAVYTNGGLVLGEGAVYPELCAGRADFRICRIVDPARCLVEDARIVLPADTDVRIVAGAAIIRTPGGIRFELPSETRTSRFFWPLLSVAPGLRTGG